MTARHRVLIVDDEPAVLAALQLAFEDDATFTVTVATTAEEALALAARRPFDVVITDKNLPGDSGLGLVRALRDGGQQQPVILITGYANADSRRQASALLRVTYVEKPFGNIYDIPKLAAELLAAAPKAAP